MGNVYNFKLFTHMCFGEGSSKELGKILAEKGIKRVGFIVDTGVFPTDAVKQTIEETKKHCSVEKVFENKVSEPTYDQLDEIRAQFKETMIDAVVGIGGGSTLDISKGIATLMKNSGKALEYRGFNVQKVPSLPVIAIPTTAGTGSEVTPYAVFTDTNEQRKFGINSDYNYPKIAVLDPLMTISCPIKPTVSAGIDALVHTVESYVAKGATETSRVFATAAFPLIFNNLPKLVENLQDVELRGRLLLGSHYAGISLMNAGAGPAGAMSYPLGVDYRVPHGIAGGVFIPKIAKFNVENGYTGYARLYDLIDGADKGVDDKEKSRLFAEKVQELCTKIGVPAKLSEFGIKEEDVKILTEKTMGNLKAAIDQNPIAMGDKEMEDVIRSML